MKHRIALCVGLTALAVAAATAAPAQTYIEPPGAPPPPPAESGGMPPSEALMIARTSGLRPLTQPARQGPNWVLLASDNMGGQLRVMINARTGRIVHASPAYDPRFAYAPMRPRGYVPVPAPQYGTIAPPQRYGAAPPPDLREPTPPRSAARSTPPSQQTPPPAARAPQNQSLAGAPDITGSVPSRPVRTPLPRPRPAIAANEAGAGAPAPTPPTRARPVVETSPEAEASSTPAAAPPAAAPAKPAPAETQMIPVAPLD